MMSTTSPQPPGALVAPAVARNREPILAVLHRVLPERGVVLEIASGSGEHAIYFAAALPHLTWQPSDPDPEARESIAAYRAAAPLPNLLPPLALDVASPNWPVTQADVIVAINMIHIAPWAAAEGLMAGAERLLPEDGVLFLYGPFRERGQHTAPSNAAFDESLRARNREWGVRDLEDVTALARRHGFALEERAAMPANNLSVVFRRRTP
jgi:SAM-dependent methyltransferase